MIIIRNSIFGILDHARISFFNVKPKDKKQNK